MADSNIQNGHNESNGDGLASKLMHEHAAHGVTVEEVVDEADLKHSEEPKSSSIIEAPGDEAAPGWVPPVSAKVAGKQKQDPPAQTKIDPFSETLFPSLGKPTQPVVSTWGANTSNSAGFPAQNGTNGAPKPTAPIRLDPRKINIPNQVTEDFPLKRNQILPRQEMKKPLTDILKDMNRKSTKKVTVSHSINHATQETIFTVSGPSRDAVVKAWGDVVSQVGAKIIEKVSIPQSARAHIIGKAGSKIKEIQEKTGARIHIPKMEDSPRPTAEDDDPIIEILVEGNAFSVGTAQREILKIAKDKTPDSTSTIRSIPAELYPFISQNEGIRSLAGQNVDLRVPAFSTWKDQAPPQKPEDLQPAIGDNHISLRGERQAVIALKAEIERYAAELMQQIAIDQFLVDKDRHRFIIGKLGMTAEDFLTETGCAIILPDEDDDEITIIGPPKLIPAAKKKAQSQHGSMQNGRCDIQKLSKNNPGNGSYARNLTQYLRQRKAVEQVEADFDAHIVTSGEAPWEVFARDYNNISGATTELGRIVRAHPPARMNTVTVEPFYYKYLEKDITPKVKSDFGVHIVVPSDNDGPVILIFEGDEGEASEYKVSREQPGQDELREFKQGLEDAQKYILDLIGAQAAITSEKVEVPTMIQEKLRRFIKAENTNGANGSIPVRVSSTGTTVTLRGPEPSVKTLAAKVNVFVEEAIQDEKERGFTMSFDFPQKHANQLIGKGGSFIRELRDKFDVEIQVEDGKVELKGPKAKAEKARQHITNLGKQWADETTHLLQIDPVFHSELIGQAGGQITRLQDKYKVQVFFPRSGRSTKEDPSVGETGSETGKKGGRRDQGPNDVIVKGPKKGADEARGELLDLVQYLKDNSYTATVSVQQSQVPSLIGQGGKTMDDLRTTTGARIDVPKSRDPKDASGNVDVQIKGTKSQVAQAKKLIEEKKNIFDHIVKESLDIEKKHHKSLVGTRGSKLREIIANAGGSDRDTTIQVPRVDADDTLIKIEGNKEVVEKIMATIQKITADLDSQETDSIDVPIEQHRMLIGRGGETKKDLESKFKVWLEIPKQGSGLTEVKITGLPADVETAKAHIAQLSKDQEGETVQIPRGLHHTIADNGQFFRSLQNKHHVSVNHDRQAIPPRPMAPTASRTNGGSMPLITDDDEDAADAFSWTVIQVEDSELDGEIPWVLRGSAENVTKAKAEILKALEQASKNDSRGFLVLPDPSKYKYVIGTKGATVNSIREETGCKINVPQQDAKDESIEIFGTAEGIEKAKNLILKVANGPKNDGGNRRF